MEFHTAPVHLAGLRRVFQHGQEQVTHAFQFHFARPSGLGPGPCPVSRFSKPSRRSKRSPVPDETPTHLADGPLLVALGVERAEAVTMETVFRVLAENIERVKGVLLRAIPAIPSSVGCECGAGAMYPGMNYT